MSDPYNRDKPVMNDPRGFMRRIEEMQGMGDWSRSARSDNLMSAAKKMGIKTDGRPPEDVAAELWEASPTDMVGEMIERSGIRPPWAGTGSMKPDSGLMNGDPMRQQMPPMHGEGGASSGIGLLPGRTETMSPMMRRR